MTSTEAALMGTRLAVLLEGGIAQDAGRTM
jgi:hypothetical protein